MIRVLAGIAVITQMSSVAFAAPEKNVHTLVAEANRAFADGNYIAALETYKTAESVAPHSPELAYNQGVAYYKLGDLSAARDAFNRSLLTRDIELEAKVKFNLANVAYASALEMTSHPAEAIDFLKSAIGHYRDAVELDPMDEDARTNIELAHRLIRHLLEKLKQEQDERQQQDDQEQREGDEGDRQRDEHQAGQREGGAEQQPEQSRQQTGEGMTRQEVGRLLQAVRDKERQRRNELLRRRRAPRTPVEKDW